MTCTSLTKPLSKGSENSEGLTLQQFLFDGGYLTIKPNGYFGAGTVTAVKKFQIANGISPVGSIGAGTRGKVKEVSCSKKGTALTLKTMQQVAQSTSTNSTQIVSSESQWLEDPGKGDYLISRATSPYLQIISKKFAYTAAVIDEKGEEKRFVVYDGKEIGKEYDNASFPISIGGKLAYIAEKDNKSFVVYDGKKISDQYDSILSTQSIGEKLVYYVKNNVGGKNKFFIVYDGKKIGEKYNTSLPPIDVDGKLVYIGMRTVSSVLKKERIQQSYFIVREK